MVRRNANSSVLLTGGTGFLGRGVSAHLVNNGFRVNLLSRSAKNSRTTCPDDVRIHTYFYDGTQQSINKSIQGASPNAVLHLATHYVRAHQSADIPELVNSNIMLPALLLESMDKHNVRNVLIVGTYWQYEDGAGFSPVNLYAATKEAAEKIATFYAKKRGLSVKILYVPDTYGPSDERDKLIPNLLRSLEANVQFHINSPDTVINLLHVDDVSRAVTHCMSLPWGSGVSRWRIESRQFLTIKEVVDCIKSKIKDEKSRLISMGTQDVTTCMSDGVSFAPLLPDWCPSIDLEVGLQQVLEGRV